MEGKYSKYFIIIIILLLFIFSVNVIPYFKNTSDFMSSISKIFDDHHGVIEVIAIAVAVVTFWLTLRQQEIDRKKELKRRLNRARQSISEEIRDIQNTFNLRNQIMRTTAAEFYNIFYNYDSYESVLHSGLFSYFSNNAQTIIKRLYHVVKLHNTFLAMHFHMGISFLPQGQYPENINRVSKPAKILHDICRN